MSRESWQSLRGLTLVGIAVVPVLGMFGLIRHSKNSSNRQSGVDTANKAISDNAPANPELREVKMMHQDLLALLDQNMNEGEGYKKNQTLAFDTMMSLQKEQMKLSNASAQKYLGELNRLVSRYYDQLAQYNSETDQLRELNLQSAKEADSIEQDPSLSEDEKFSRKRAIKNSAFDKALERTVDNKDIGETAKTLHDLLAAGLSTNDQGRQSPPSAASSPSAVD
jgi:hypothetical protein